MTRVRQIMCLLAAVLAALAGVVVLFEFDIRAHDAVALDLFLLAAAAAVLGSWRSEGDWSDLRRLAVIAVAIAWFVVSLLVLVNLIVIAGCACEPGSRPVSPLAAFGITTLNTRAIGVFAAVAAPVLLIAAGLLPSRRSPAEDSDLV